MAQTRGNARYGYDDFDRLAMAEFPKAADGTPNPTDTELYDYDENGNLTQKITRAGDEINNLYDNLNRITSKSPVKFSTADLAPTVTYAYDAAGRQTVISDSNGLSLSNTYDAAGRVTELAFEELSTDEALDLYSQLITLCQLIPALWVTCGRAAAALTGFIGR